MIEFKEFDKIARLRRGVMVTEKIDGTNACVVIQPVEDMADHLVNPPLATFELGGNGHEPVRHGIWAQSRNCMITPERDNYGFAKWVATNHEDLQRLGPGYHYGEWWGSGIQRRYDQQEKHFSLFNAHRWDGVNQVPPTCCRTVPILSVKTMDVAVQESLVQLREQGSAAAPGFMKPEGIVVWHTQSRIYYKVTLEKDEEHKWEAKNKASPSAKPCVET